MSVSEISNFKLKNIIGLDDIQNENENFTLRSPPKGKVFRGPISNAFNRQSLGSIPVRFEKILFKEIESEVKKGFWSQCQRFTQYRMKESVKNSYPGPGEYNNPNNMNRIISNNPSFSTKGYGTGFTSKNQRFDDLREFQEKYLPGPGEYKSKISLDHQNFNKSNLRYKSLYNRNKIISLKIYKDNPGPGDYDPVVPGLLRKDEINSPSNFFFESKEERFNKFNEKANNNPGPGKYFLDLNLPKKSFNNEETSFFFKENIPKKENPIEKFLNIEKNKKFETPGPGLYNLRKEIIKSELNFFSPNNIQLTEGKKKLLEIEKEREKENLKNEIRIKQILSKSQNKNNSIHTDNNKKGIKSVFLSKSPRNNYAKSNHFPGPSYYHPNFLPERISFNMNEEKVWI